jgi:hypothetical protein
MEPIQAAPIPAFATRIPGRVTQFKPHKMLSHVKVAVTASPDWFLPDNELIREWDGRFTQRIVVYRLDPFTVRYEPWLTVRPGDTRSQHPALLPLSRIHVPGGPDYSAVAQDPAVRRLRHSVHAAMRGLGVTSAQLRQKAAAGTLDPVELSLWGLVRGGLPESRL